MRLQFQKRSALKLASRTVPRMQSEAGLMTLAENEHSEVNETQASETKCTEACWSNYPLSEATWYLKPLVELSYHKQG